MGALPKRMDDKTLVLPLSEMVVSASALGIRPKCGVSGVLVKSFRVVKRWCRETPWCVVAVSRTRPPSYSSEREAVRP